MSMAERAPSKRGAIRWLAVRVATFVLTGRFHGETLWSLRRRSFRRLKWELMAFGTVVLMALYVQFVMPPGVWAFLRTVLLLATFFAVAPFVVQFIGAKIAVNLEYPGNDLTAFWQDFRSRRTKAE